MHKILIYVMTLALVLSCSRRAEQAYFTENFDDDALASRGWYDESRIRIAGDAAAGEGCIEYEWNSESKGVGSAALRHLHRPSDEVYLRFYLKLSRGWGWTAVNYHPHLTHFMTTENSEYHGPAASHLTLYVEPVNGRLRLAATDIQNKDMPHGLTQGELRGGYNGKLYDSEEMLFDDAEWHCIEAYFKLNTLDMENDRPNADGIVRGWFDNELVVDHDDVILRSTDFPEMEINQFLMAPHFGPGLLPHAQKLWIDELVVGRERIGPLPADHQQSVPKVEKENASEKPVKYVAYSTDAEAYFMPRDFEFFQGEFTDQIMGVCREFNIPFTWLIIVDEEHTEVSSVTAKVYPDRKGKDEFSLHAHFKWFIMDTDDDFESFKIVDRRMAWLRDAKKETEKAGLPMPRTFRYGGGDSQDSIYFIEDLIYLHDELGVRNYLFKADRLPEVIGINRADHKGNNVWTIDGGRELTLLPTCVYLDKDMEEIIPAIDKRLSRSDFAIIGSHDYREDVPVHLKESIEYLNSHYNVEYVSIDHIGELVRKGEIENIHHE